MLQSIFTVSAGMRAEQSRIDIIANNMANISTTGFKGSRAEFAEALYAQMKQPIQSGTYLQDGSGLILSSTAHNWSAGDPMATGSNTDFMLNGPGFFTVQGAQGQTYYTRDGSFRLSELNGSAYLTTANGDFVLGSDGKRIQFPPNTAGIAADPSGVLVSDGAVAQLGIATFPNPSGLSSAGGNRYTTTAASGTARKADASTAVLQGYLEGSNVDTSEEMTRLIVAQRAFAVMGNAERTADEIEQSANNMSR